MMKAYVVVEGMLDAVFLRAVLPKELLKVTELVAAGERSNLASVARTLLITRRKPLAIVADADAMDEGSVHEKQQSTEELVRAVAAGLPTKVILVRPALEALFFE